MSRPDSSSSRGTKRRLVFLSDLFHGEKFYLDIQDTDVDRKLLENDIAVLGGKVEKFLSSDVTGVITGTYKHAQDESNRRKSRTQSKILVKSAVMSRGQALLLRSSSVTQGSERSNNSSCDPITFAKKWGIKVSNLADIQRIIRAERLKCDARTHNTVDPLKEIGQGSHLTVRNLKGCIIKFEDNSRKFKPVCQQFKEPSKLYTASETFASPFDNPGRKTKPSRPNIGTEQKCCRSRDASDSTKKKKSEKKQGYCESCDTYYSDIVEHCLTDSHIQFAENKENFKVLDETIGSLPDLSFWMSSISKLKDIENDFKRTAENKLSVCGLPKDQNCINLDQTLGHKLTDVMLEVKTDPYDSTSNIFKRAGKDVAQGTKEKHVPVSSTLCGNIDTKTGEVANQLRDSKLSCVTDKHNVPKCANDDHTVLQLDDNQDVECESLQDIETKDIHNEVYINTNCDNGGYKIDKEDMKLFPNDSFIFPTFDTFDLSSPVLINENDFTMSDFLGAELQNCSSLDTCVKDHKGISVKECYNGSVLQLETPKKEHLLTSFGSREEDNPEFHNNNIVLENEPLMPNLSIEVPKEPCFQVEEKDQGVGTIHSESSIFHLEVGQHTSNPMSKDNSFDLEDCFSDITDDSLPKTCFDTQVSTGIDFDSDEETQWDIDLQKTCDNILDILGGENSSPSLPHIDDLAKLENNFQNTKISKEALPKPDEKKSDNCQDELIACPNISVVGIEKSNLRSPDTFNIETTGGNEDINPATSPVQEVETCVMKDNLGASCLKSAQLSRGKNIKYTMGPLDCSDRTSSSEPEFPSITTPTYNASSSNKREEECSSEYQPPTLNTSHENVPKDDLSGTRNNIEKQNLKTDCSVESVSSHLPNSPSSDMVIFPKLGDTGSFIAAYADYRKRYPLSMRQNIDTNSITESSDSGDQSVNSSSSAEPPSQKEKMNECGKFVSAEFDPYNFNFQESVLNNTSFVPGSKDALQKLQTVDYPSSKAHLMSKQETTPSKVENGFRSLRDTWRVRSVSDLKIKFSKVLLTPKYANGLEDKSNAHRKWNVQRSGNCKLIFSNSSRNSSSKRKNLDEMIDTSKRRKLVY